MPMMKSTAYSRSPLAKPSVAASATSCHASKFANVSMRLLRHWLLVVAVRPRTLILDSRSCRFHPRRQPLAEESGDAFAAFGRRAHRRDVLRRSGDHVRVDRPMRDAADQCLAFELRGRTRRLQHRDECVDARVDLLTSYHFVHESDAQCIERANRSAV